MAWLQRDPSAKFHLSFRIGGSKFKRSLKTKNENEAETIRRRVEETIVLIERGRVQMPPGVDIPTFLISDGKLAEKPKVEKAATLNDLFVRYFESLPEGGIEESTWKCLQIHRNHLLEIMGGGTLLSELGLEALQSYVNARSKKRGQRGRRISPITIRQELATLRAVWNWGVSIGELDGPFPMRKIKFPKIIEKPPFQTCAEISSLIQSHNLSANEARDLWDCLFLTLPEVDELLAFVRENARQPFIYPMIVMAAHTGARRSEICRSERRDIDFASGMLTIREKKRIRGKESTRRVPITPTLRSALTEWLAIHPGGPWTFAQVVDVPRRRNPRSGPTPITRDEAHHHFAAALAGGKWSILRGWHCLRHSFITNCVAKGIDQRLIDQWVGHTTDDMRRRYAHLVPNVAKEAIESVFCE